MGRRGAGGWRWGCGTSAHRVAMGARGAGGLAAGDGFAGRRRAGGWRWGCGELAGRLMGPTVASGCGLLHRQGRGTTGIHGCRLSLPTAHGPLHVCVCVCLCARSARHPGWRVPAVRTSKRIECHTCCVSGAKPSVMCIDG